MTAESVRTVGVYNRYWTTGGGAETYGAAMAQVLARTRQVEILGPEEVDLDALEARLRLDLSGIGFRRIPARSGWVTRASADYDLFVNVSYLSRDPSIADRSLYVVHFPDQIGSDLTRAQRTAIRLAQPLVDAPTAESAWGEGFYPREGGRPFHFWTSDRASFHVQAQPDRAVPVRMLFARARMEAAPPAEVTVLVDDHVEAQVTVDHGDSRWTRRRLIPLTVHVPADPRGGESEVRFEVDPFVPSDIAGGDDDRRLGVALRTLHPGDGMRHRLGARLGSWFPVLHRSLAQRDFIATYDRVVTNSAFTLEWVRRWWQADGSVLFPPVRLHDEGPAPKEQIILGVGRFFAAQAGHSKKQLELVEAFRALRQRGVEGWTLHLVGGCSAVDEPYLEAVREAAQGLPVEFHVNAPGEQLADLYDRATLFWHATGLGEDPELHPERLEHFGIATVEAMSAGAVPLVLGAAGQLEIVQDGVSGRHFATLGELVDRTAELIADPDELARLATGAAERAQHFGLDAFAERLEAILSDIEETPGSLN